MVAFRSPNFWLALIILLAVMGLFFVIVCRQLGGDQALFLIIGHVAAWLEIIVIFFWRKKPPEAKPPTTGS